MSYQYDNEIGAFGKVVIFILLIALAVGGYVAVFGLIPCNAMTRDIGFASRYSIFGGCQVEVTPGQWIPLSSYYFRQGAE